MCRSTLLLMVLVVAGCSSGSTQSSSPTTPGVRTAPPGTPGLTPGATLEPAQTAGDAPPAAQLAAEGGDPVIGQLGTYIWGEGGSDSPWLPGASIAVGSGEPLSVTLQSQVAVATWRARSVPSSADGPDGASLLGEGTGDPEFGAPATGSWTVEVHVVFGGGVGDASYFWRLEVS